MWTQLGSSNSSGCNRGAAVEVDAIGAAATEASANGEQQQLKRIDAIGEQQLCTESCSAPDYSRRQMRGK